MDADAVLQQLRSIDVRRIPPDQRAAFAAALERKLDEIERVFTQSLE